MPFKKFYKQLKIYFRCSNFRDNLKTDGSKRSLKIPQTVLENHKTTPNNGLKAINLENGMKILSIASNSTQSTLGFALKSGPLYEKKPGLSYILSKLLLKSSNIFDNPIDLTNFLSITSTIYDSQINRDSMFYAFSSGDKDLTKLLELFTDLIFTPKINEEMLQKAKYQAIDEMNVICMNRDPEIFLKNQLLYKSAFQGTPLANSIIYTEEELSSISIDDIHEHLSTLHTPENVVIASIGPEPDEICNLCSKIPSKSNNSKIKNYDFNTFESQKSFITHNIDLSRMNNGLNSLPELAHILVALPLPFHPSNDEDLKLYCAQLLLQTLFGGGSSFSSGGPGKGLHSKFYTENLNRYHWLSHLSASIKHCSGHSGFLMIQGSCEPRYINKLANMLSYECLEKLYRPCMRLSDFNRSKKQLKMNMYLSQEQDPVLMENIATEWIRFGKWLDSSSLSQAIDELQIQDVDLVAKKIVEGNMSIVAMGNLHDIPDQKYFEKNHNIVLM